MRRLDDWMILSQHIMIFKRLSKPQGITDNFNILFEKELMFFQKTTESNQHKTMHLKPWDQITSPPTTIKHREPRCILYLTDFINLLISNYTQGC